ncbi:hypothetical protein NKG94_49125 [Micromonospora sp. M12]
MTLRDDQPGVARPDAATHAGPAAVSPAPWTVLVVLACAQAMVALDVTVVNVALPAIDADLRFGPGTCSGWSPSTCWLPAVCSSWVAGWRICSAPDGCSWPG